MAWDDYSGGYGRAYQQQDYPYPGEGGGNRYPYQEQDYPYPGEQQYRPEQPFTPPGGDLMSLYTDQASRAANAQARGASTNLYGGSGGAMTNAAPVSVGKNIGGDQGKAAKHPTPVTSGPSQILTPELGNTPTTQFDPYQPNLGSFMNFLKFVSQFGPMMYGNRM